MDNKTAVQALAALAQDSRLAVYRHLVQAGPAGVAAGELAARLGIPPNTLSFHLKTLSQAGLVEVRPAGRYSYYSASYPAMNALLGFLSDNCCGGQPCAPQSLPTRRRKAS
jgi:ArsR family transcriptional regulator